MIAQKWLLDESRVSVKNMVKAFTLSGRRAAHILKVETIILRECPDMLGIEARTLSMWDTMAACTSLVPLPTARLFVRTLTLQTLLHFPKMWTDVLQRTQFLDHIMDTQRALTGGGILPVTALVLFSRSTLITPRLKWSYFQDCEGVDLDSINKSLRKCMEMAAWI